MHARATAASPESLSYLPAFFRDDIEQPDHPIRSLLQVFETDLHMAEWLVDASHMLFEPEQISLLLSTLLSRLENAWPIDFSALPESSLVRSREMDYLNWLGSWVGVALDQDWLGRTPYTKAFMVIKNAAQLYRERGTPSGLKRIIALFCDLDVDIIERSWPSRMQIGVSSAIGLNTWLLDEIDLKNQFTVLIRLTDPNYHRLQRVGLTIESELVGPEDELKIAWPWTESPAQLTSNAAFATFDKLRRLIEMEKPAHTSYYLAFESEGTPKSRPLSPLVIEVDSTIEGCWIS